MKLLILVHKINIALLLSKLTIKVTKWNNLFRHLL